MLLASIWVEPRAASLGTIPHPSNKVAFLNLLLVIILIQTKEPSKRVTAAYRWVQ